MINKKFIMLSVLLVTLTLSAVSAGNNITSDIVGVSDDTDLDILKENNTNAKSFSELDEAINGNNDSDIYLDCDYEFNSTSDSKGVEIRREVAVHGNGHTLDANNNDLGILYTNSKVILKDMIFVNSRHGALFYGTAINCTFKNNSADYGRAINYVNATDCTFLENSAKYGGAAEHGTPINCTFTRNTAGFGGAVNNGNATNCKFENNHAKFE